MLFIVFIFGLVIGSFLNVCIYRIPAGLSTAFPASHCTGCKHPLKPYELIPVLGYIINRGRCRYCGIGISVQYPLIELLNGIIYLLLYLKYGMTSQFIMYALLMSILIVVSLIDLKTQEIPDSIMLFGLLSGSLFIIFYHNLTSLINGLSGLLIGGALFLFIAIASKGAMGGGDIKLMAVLGLFLGWQSILLLTLLSFIIGSVISLILMAVKAKKRKDYIPFGPFIALAFPVVVFYGENMINWYLTFLR